MIKYKGQIYSSADAVADYYEQYESSSTCVINSTSLTLDDGRVIQVVYYFGRRKISLGSNDNGCGIYSKNACLIYHTSDDEDTDY